MTKAKKPVEIFDVVNIILMILMMVVMLFPFWYAVVGSFNDGTDYLTGGVYLWPRKFTTYNYKAVFRDKTILSSFGITALKAIVGTVTSLFVTSLAAYALSRPQLKGKKFYIPYMMLTMYFGGGMVPTYLIVKETGLINNMWALFLPGGVAVGNMIL